MKRISTLLIAFVLCLSFAAPIRAASSVFLSPQNLSVNGVLKNVEKYNIDGINYFKLRDLAFMLNGTANQFNVGWDSANNAVIITTKKAYSPDGSEMKPGADKSASAVKSKQTVMIDGKTRSDLSVYNIGGSNFFQLRELGNIIGFSVDYDSSLNAAVVTTSDHIDKKKMAREMLAIIDRYADKDNSYVNLIDMNGDGIQELYFVNGKDYYGKHFLYGWNNNKLEPVFEDVMLGYPEALGFSAVVAKRGEEYSLYVHTPFTDGDYSVYDEDMYYLADRLEQLYYYKWVEYEDIEKYGDAVWRGELDYEQLPWQKKGGKSIYPYGTANLLTDDTIGPYNGFGDNPKPSVEIELTEAEFEKLSNEWVVIEKALPPYTHYEEVYRTLTQMLQSNQ